jgi:mRNA interferase RelE/StbE
LDSNKTTYDIRILDTATRELARLDKSAGSRIVERINRLAKNLDNIKPEALTGDLAGLYKLRVGNYRVLYEIIRNERAIVIHSIGHRREIYRKK